MTGPGCGQDIGYAQDLAVRWLARREYSRAELTQRLLRRGIAADEVERALDDLAAAGYLSDARYAHAVVAQRVGRFGKRAIVHALKERGIAAADVAGRARAAGGNGRVGGRAGVVAATLRRTRPPTIARRRARSVFCKRAATVCPRRCAYCARREAAATTTCKADAAQTASGWLRGRRSRYNPSF